MPRAKSKRGAAGTGPKLQPAAEKKAKGKGKAQAKAVVLAVEPQPEVLLQSSALVLPDCLDSSAAFAVKDLLLARRGSALVVDASQVRRIGAQSLQVLVAAAQTWQADGVSYHVESPSPEFLDTIALIGLTREALLLEGAQI